tara:strand:- start:14 stop:934 length:921 start_codon:yes stop_codon:yes gene_type:complete
MKTVLLVTLFLIQVISLKAQYCSNHTYTFEDSTCMESFSFDTLSNPNNIWQIGVPQKNTFDSAYSASHAILTDTVNPYPTNDTSTFIITHRTSDGFPSPHTVFIDGYYQVNSDSLNDYGIIEFSPDNGVTWIDLINDTLYSSYYEWWSVYGKPVLTGNSNGWQHFHVELSKLGPVFNIQFQDTVKYRFTFISDNKYDSLDGLIFDDLYFQDYTEGIGELSGSSFSSNAYPNPAKNEIQIQFEKTNNSSFNLTVYDISGRQIWNQEVTTESPVKVNTSRFKSGVYHYHLVSQTENKWSTGKFIIAKE